MSRLSSPLMLLASVAALGSGCRLNPYETGNDGRWQFPDGGPGLDGTVTADASPDACVPVAELCDGVDNDCDGVVDDGFDLQADPNNCGTCGQVCSYDNAVSACQDASCVMEGCLPGYWNVNQDPEDGCEYLCHVTNDATEICDGRDNDCDGDTDEDFDLQSDPRNCGACSNVCVFLNGFGACVGAQCTLASCRGGYVDVDGSTLNGCECRMDLTEGGVSCVEGQPGACGAGEVCADADRDGQAHCATIPLDVCDGRDNDCDGQTDEDALSHLPGSDCYAYPSGCVENPPGSGSFDCEGRCATGTWQCLNGGLVCGGQTGPAAESCNDLDDDCNGTVDDGVDKLTDPNNCGGCGVSCGPLVPNAIPSCVGGQCTVFVCLPGFWDLDPIQPGCEYPCVVTNGGVEACGDGLDNDCNGQTDEGFVLSSDPTNCGACSHNCEVVKPFGTQVATPGCASGACRFECLPNYYDRNGDLPTLGEAGNGCESYCAVTSPTELCDGEDNDCNGQVDEGFNLLTDPANCGVCGRSCEAIKGANTVVVACSGGSCQFACAGPQFVDLNGDIALGSAGTGCECQVGAEVCDGVDNDCNGVVDDANAGGCTVYYHDADQDGHGDPADSRCLCAADAAARYTALAAGDCNDQNAAVHPGATEVCDGVDNDCDGQTDRTALGVSLTRPCYTGPVGTQGFPPCQGGTQTCTAGIWSPTCVGEVTPQLEVCDGLDNDCDGLLNEGFDLTTNPLHCGACNYRCSDHVPNAVSTCQASVCVVVSCLPGFYDLNPLQAGCEYACTPQNGGVKTCGSPVDNDCNGIVDLDEFFLDHDVLNCGQCGYSCDAHRPPGTRVQDAPDGCVASHCQYECLSGFHDVDLDLPTNGENGTGCECEESNSGVEICDELDNDCDGDVDEGFDLLIDPVNCGSCNTRCVDQPIPANAQLAPTPCASGRCQFVCQTNFHDLNGNLDSGLPPGPGNDGCEYACTPSGAESCNGVDDDCNGLFDEGADLQPLRRTCYTGSAGTETHSPCRTGFQTCVAPNTWSQCLGEITPVPEICGDGVDNDCNGTADDGFNLQTDVENCGACGHNCLLAFPAHTTPASPGCVLGKCQYDCIAGFNDLDNDRSSGQPPGPLNNGCEYTCPRYPPVAEECNDLDDNCNGQADEGLPATQDICPRADRVDTPCFGVLATCRDPDGGGALPKGWYCSYGPQVEVSPISPNIIAAAETRCDGYDGNCDGTVDETFTTLGQECDNGLLGACRDVGQRACDPGNPAQTLCDLTFPPDADPAAPEPEQCNGVDDNCDGIVDNPDPLDPDRVIDDMVHVTHVAPDFWIYTFEASRPDADDTTVGVMDERACSQSGVLPWHTVTFDEAESACLAVGKRLCTDEEWQAACEGAAHLSYPYGNLYEPATCNGVDYDGIPGGADDDVLLPAGETVDCHSPDAVFDLSGNLREWTDDQRGSTPGGDPIYVVRGGEYHTPATGLTCTFDKSRAVYNVVLPTIGFRCCSDDPP